MSDALIRVAGPLAATLVVAAPSIAARKNKLQWWIYLPLILVSFVAASMAMGG